MAKRRSPSRTFPTLRPDLQIDFYNRLKAIKHSYLQEALGVTIQKLDISDLDRELATYVSRKYLRHVASFGLRGEIFFPIPRLLNTRPSLLGYYRLLYGLSQKEFYRDSRLAPFKRLEERNELPPVMGAQLPVLCKSLVRTGQILVDGMDTLSLQNVRDLQLMTLGAQLRGSQNTRRGKSAVSEVFTLIENLTRPYIQNQTTRMIELENESSRTVVIAFSNDPDIAVTEKLPSGVRSLVSVEIKGGTDISNIHNRIGEAEKAIKRRRIAGLLSFGPS